MTTRWGKVAEKPKVRLTARTWSRKCHPSRICTDQTCPRSDFPINPKRKNILREILSFSFQRRNPSMITDLDPLANLPLKVWILFWFHLNTKVIMTTSYLSSHEESTIEGDLFWCLTAPFCRLRHLHKEKQFLVYFETKKDLLIFHVITKRVNGENAKEISNRRKGESNRRGQCRFLALAEHKIKYK